MEQVQPNTAELFADNCGAQMKVDYIPTLDAREQRKASGHWPMLKYRVTLVKGGVSHQFDWNAGIGHIKGLKTNNLTLDDEERLLHVYKTGKKARFFSNIRSQVPEKELAFTPSLSDVLYSLIMDSDVLNHPTLESWAGDFGYDPDSRSAERIYNACIKNALKLRQLINTEAAAEAFADY